MKLRALAGEFFGQVNAEERSCRRQDNQLDGAQGVMFQCPKCAEGKPPGEPDGVGFAGAHYIRVCFSNPLNAPVAPAEFDKNPRWQMSGAGLDDLTLAPSINLDVPDEKGEVHGCRWHGFVTNGDAA